jgi:hypothetical protein
MLENETPKWRKGKYTDGPNECGYYTAGIDASMLDIHNTLDWHLHAIEFHSRDKDMAERRRDLVFKLLTEIV